MDENKRDAGNLEVSLLEIFSVLLSKIGYIVLIVAVAAVGSYLYTKERVIPMYSSGAQIYLKNSAADEIINTSEITAATMLVNDCKELLKTDVVLQKVIDQLELSVSTDTVRAALQISVLEDSRVLNITVNYPNPQDAMNIANTLCEVAQQMLPELSKVQSVTITSYAKLSGAPYAPNYKQNVGLAALLAFIFSSAIFIVIDVLNDRIKTPEDAEKYLDMSILGMIPEAKHTDKKRRRHSR